MPYCMSSNFLSIKILGNCLTKFVLFIKLISQCTLQKCRSIQFQTLASKQLILERLMNILKVPLHWTTIRTLCKLTLNELKQGSLRERSHHAFFGNNSVKSNWYHWLNPNFTKLCRRKVLYNCFCWAKPGREP